MSEKETIRIHECYFLDFCIEFQSKILEGWKVTEADATFAFARPGVYLCNMSRDIVKEDQEPQQKSVGRPKISKQ